MRSRNVVLAAAMGVALLVTTIGPASASFPGQDTVAFVRYNGTAWRVMRMKPNGTEQRKVVGPETEVGLYGAAMSPDGKRVVYAVHDGIQTDLHVQRIGGGSKQITDTPNRNEWSPMWSPDGRSIVFMETDESTYSAIVRRKADGTQRREIDRSTQDYLLFPSVSPDGDRVLYSRVRGVVSRGDGDYELVTKKIDGTGRKWLTDTAKNEVAGDWAPDGDRVAFLVEPALLKPRPLGSPGTFAGVPTFRGPIARPVFSIRSQGGGKRLITDKPGIVGRVLYTPDGKRVMFSRFTSDSLDLFSTPVSGGVLKRLTQTTETYNLFDLFNTVT